MKIQEFHCPSCGAELKIKKGQKTLTCPYCDSTVIVPDSFLPETPPENTRVTTSFQPEIIINPVDVKRSYIGTIISLVIVTILSGVVFFLFQMKAVNVQKILEEPVSSITGDSDIPAVLEFGGSGMSPGFFQDPEFLCVDTGGNIYVGENETGRIQIFDPDGNYTGQWSFSDSDIYLRSMAISRDGLLYMIYDNSIFIHDARTGEVTGSLQHPDGWGLNDAEVCNDGSVVASWYRNRDDIIKFAPDGSVDFIIMEAISGRSGDSELDTDISVDGNGNIFAYGSFNESVFKFSSDGQFLNRFGSEGDHPGQFTFPSAFCLDREGRLWVSDFGDLKVFDNDGSFLAVFDPGITVHDIFIDDDYQLYGITSDDTVVKLDLTGVVEDL